MTGPYKNDLFLTEGCLLPRWFLLISFNYSTINSHNWLASSVLSYCSFWLEWIWDRDACCSASREPILFWVLYANFSIHSIPEALKIIIVSHYRLFIWNIGILCLCGCSYLFGFYCSALGDEPIIIALEVPIKYYMEIILAALFRSTCVCGKSKSNFWEHLNHTVFAVYLQAFLVYWQLYKYVTGVCGATLINEKNERFSHYCAIWIKTSMWVWKLIMNALLETTDLVLFCRTMCFKKFAIWNVAFIKRTHYFLFLIHLFYEYAFQLKKLPPKWFYNWTALREHLHRLVVIWAQSMDR